MNILYITGAGVSAESGIPTFRGEDGFWTIGSKNYTPQEMATRAMYQQHSGAFLQWYYHRFAQYRNHQPNDVHYWLANKNLITQNIDGLDGKAGNNHYIPIHGRLDKVTLFHNQQDAERGNAIALMDAPWQADEEDCLADSLQSLFKIDTCPKLNFSLKPYVLLFDEYYTELYRISEAQERMLNADKMVFMGTSFSVNITQMALQIAAQHNIPIAIVDPQPVKIDYAQAEYFQMTAMDYIQLADNR